MSVTAAPPVVAPPNPGVESRAVEALLACIARFGLAKTTLDDVAREARCSRATLYRYFDGKPELVRRTVAAEQTRITVLVVEAGHAEPSLADAIIAATSRAARELVVTRRPAVPPRPRTRGDPRAPRVRRR